MAAGPGAAHIDDDCLASTGPDTRGPTYEDEHVHRVYDAIAPHFSATRYKPWPIIARFLEAQPPGTLGLDAGAGNGKNLSVNATVALLASDRSAALLRHATSHTADSPSDVLVADALALPHPPARFDFALCIAVVHHFSTRARRVAALRELLRALRPRVGRALVYVWALEQRGSRRGWDVGHAQDVMVPWVLQRKAANGEPRGAAGEDSSDGAGDGPRTFHRFYHLYREGELEEDIQAAGGFVEDAGYEKDNWWAIAST